jgi:hypothetical protein
MSENKNSGSLPAVTAEVAKAEIRLSLTKAELNIQAALDKANALVFNEDNLAEIKETIKAIKTVQNKIDDAHVAGKAPHWAACTAWDAAKRDLKGLLAPTLTDIEGKHTKLCLAVEKTKRENNAKEKRKKDIEEKITTTILGFSQEITAAKTTKELTSIQNRINAEQGLKTTYFEFLPILVEKCIELNPLLKEQKEAIKKLEGLETAKEQAIANNDDEALMKIEEEKEGIGEKIQETKIRVEEKAINTTTRSYGGGGGYTQTFPEVKAKRRTWKNEVKDVTALYKKFPDLVILTPNEEKINEILKLKIELGETKDKEEIDYFGLIRFFVDKKY